MSKWVTLNLKEANKLTLPEPKMQGDWCVTQW